VSAPRDERRVHPRFPRSVELRGSAASGKAYARLISSNLSMGGIYCTSDRAFPEMTRLAVRLMLPSPAERSEATAPLDLEAVVVRHKRLQSVVDEERHELALLFTAMDPAQRDRLGRFLSHS